MAISMLSSSMGTRMAKTPNTALVRMGMRVCSKSSYCWQETEQFMSECEQFMAMCEQYTCHMGQSHLGVCLLSD